MVTGDGNFHGGILLFVRLQLPEPGLASLERGEIAESALPQQLLPLPDAAAHILCRVRVRAKGDDLAALLAARAVADGACDKGIVICTTGIGVSIAANKVKGIRCALCTDSLQAEMTRRHNDANMMALGAGITGGNLAKRMVEIFLNTEFEGGRHARRVALLDAIQ